MRSIAMIPTIIALFGVALAFTADGDDPFQGDQDQNHIIQDVVFKSTSSTVSFEIDPNAIDVQTSPDTPEVLFTIKNDTGRPIDDITVTVIAKGSNGTLPVVGKIKVKEGGKKVENESEGTTDNRGETATLDFGGAGPPSLPRGNTYKGGSIEINSVGSSSSLIFKYTASSKDKPKGTGFHGDRMADFDFNTSQTSHRNVVDDASHDRIAAAVKNTDVTRNLIQLTGTVSLPAGVTLSDVILEDPVTGFDPVPGVTSSVSGSSFTLGGFSLTAGNGYDLVLVFSAAAGNYPVNLTLDAQFQQ